MQLVNWTNVTQILPPGAAEHGIGSSYVIVYDFWGSGVFLFCAMICATAAVYYIANDIRYKWRAR